jgi:tellurite resistance protein
MKWLNRLSQAIKGNSEKEQQKQQIREAMLAAVRDGVITNDELRQIIDLCNNSQLTYEELYHIRVEAFHAAVNLAISDRRITDAEEKSLHHIHAALQLPNEVFADAASKIYKYRQRNYSGGVGLDFHDFFEVGEDVQVTLPQRVYY